MIEWKDEYATGIKEIDNQHKKLFSITNEAYTLLNDEFCIDKFDRIVSILDELKAYTIYHFTFEEGYMQKIHYNKFFSQKVAHNYFVKKFDDLDPDKIDDNQNKYILGMLDFMINWITNHIISKDKLINPDNHNI